MCRRDNVRFDHADGSLGAPSSIGPVLAAVFVAEIGDVHRFAGPAQLCSWAGLTHATASPTPSCTTTTALPVSAASVRGYRRPPAGTSRWTRRRLNANAAPTISDGSTDA